jgi:hypothetical protein
MDDNKFWASVWRSVAIVLSVFFVCSFASCSYTDYQTAKLIKGGADPIKTLCAMKPGSATDSLCLAAALKGNP